jgi:hypothetical protein
MIVYDLVKEIRSGSKDKDGKADTGLAQFHSLDWQGDGKIVSTCGLHHQCELNGSMAIGIGLDQNKQLGRTLEFRPEVPVVVKAVGKVEFQP